MHRRTFLVSFSSITASNIARAEPEAAPFRPIAYEEIASDARISDAVQSVKGKDQVIVPPIFRYKLKLRTTGAIRHLDPRRRVALDYWGKAVNAPDFVARFNNEIEARSREWTFWLPWQDALVNPFMEEQKSGGEIEVNVVLTRDIEAATLLVAISFRSL